MQKLSVHAKGIRFIMQAVLLVAVIFFTASFVLAQIPSFLASEGLLYNQELSVPVHKHDIVRLIHDTVIYHSRAQALDARDKLIAQHKNFLFADLYTMTLSLYKDRASTTFPIIAKGLQGGFFEVPNGTYMIELKEERHNSFIEDIVMPFALEISGNYVIHGVPLGVNGKPLRDMYAGGGIRLSTEDAKKVFNAVDTEMSVVVAAADGQKQTSGDYFKKIPLGGQHASVANTIAGLSAASAIAADIETGQILFEKQGDTVRPIASVTKLMTALVAQETINPSKKLIVNQEAFNTAGDTGRLRVGDAMEAKDFLYPLLLSSSNDAATVYAEHVEGFVNLMNKKANDLGLHATVYQDSTGLTSKNVSTVRDLVSLLTYMYDHQQQLFSLTGLPQYTLVADNKLHSWKNATWPNNDGIFLGGKFGYTTEARQTLAAVFGVTMSEHGARPIAIVLLGSHDRKHDALRIMEHLRKNFAYGSTVVENNHPPVSPGIHAGASIFEAMKLLDGK